jgi:hypothetical protein
MGGTYGNFADQSTRSFLRIVLELPKRVSMWLLPGADCLSVVDQPSKLLPLPVLFFYILTFTYTVSFSAFDCLIFPPAPILHNAQPATIVAGDD